MVSWTDRKSRLSVFSWVVVIFFGLAALTMIGLQSFVTHELVEDDTDDLPPPTPAPPIILSQSTASSSGVSKQDVQSMLDAFATKLLNTINAKLTGAAQATATPSSSSSSSSPSGPSTPPNPIATTDPSTLSYLNGASIDLNGWGVANVDGSSWLPLGKLSLTSASASSSPSTLSYPATLVRIKSSGFWDTTDPYTVPVTITFSGPLVARKACIPAISFTLNADDSFMFTNTASVMGFPASGKPSSANYVAFSLGGSGVYGHLYRDGSLRLMQKDGSPLAPGSYATNPACVIYNAVPNTQTPPVNFAVSNCTSNADVPGTVNRQTFVGQYYEYDDMDFYGGILNIQTPENCFPMSSMVNNPGMTADATMLMAHHRFSSAGVRVGQSAPVIIDPKQVPLSRSTLEFKKLHRSSRRHTSNQQEPGLCRTQSGALVSLYFSTMGANISLGGYAVYRSTDNGATWSKNDNLLWEIGGVSTWPNYNFTIDTGDGTPFVGPYGLDFFRIPVTFAANTVLPCDAEPMLLADGTFAQPCVSIGPSPKKGMEPIISFSGNDDGAGDARCAVDAHGTVWLAGLERHTKVGHYADPVNFQHAMAWIAYSIDDGQTFQLAGHFDPADGSAFSYDYPTLAGGRDAPGTGAALWHVTKVDSTVSELILYGFTEPLEVNVFHVPSTPGRIGQITRMPLVGSAIGGYGAVALDSKSGNAYIVGGGVPGVTVDPLDPTNILSTVCGPVGGSCPALNGLVFFASCTAPPNPVCGQAQVIARTDFAANAPNSQAVRSTLTEPSIVVDKKGVIYVLYPDLAPQGPTTVDQNNALFGGYNRQANFLYLIKSTDKGKTWSTPRIINDTPYNPSNPATDVTAFRAILRYDPVSHALAAVWTDTRVDLAAATATRRYATTIAL
jgi:hypothetical protein